MCVCVFIFKIYTFDNGNQFFALCQFFSPQLTWISGERKTVLKYSLPRPSRTLLCFHRLQLCLEFICASTVINLLRSPSVPGWDSGRPGRTSDRRSTVKHHTESSSSSNCRSSLFYWRQSPFPNGRNGWLIFRFFLLFLRKIKKSRPCICVFPHFYLNLRCQGRNAYVFPLTDIHWKCLAIPHLWISTIHPCAIRIRERLQRIWAMYWPYWLNLWCGRLFLFFAQAVESLQVE